MIIKELLEAIEDSIKGGYVTLDSEVTIEMPTPGNDSYHIHDTYPWNVYFMLDKTFSLTLGKKFSELEYENVEDQYIRVDDIIAEDMKHKYDQGIITREEYVSWLKAKMQEAPNEDHG